MSEDRFLIETTCLSDNVRSYIDPHAARAEHVGVEPLEDQQPRVVIIGATVEQRELIARLTPEVVFFDEFADVDVKAFDSIDTQVQARFIVTDEDQKKMVEMFDRLAEYPPLPVAVEPNWDGVGSYGARRVKKGKFKKDWQR